MVLLNPGGMNIKDLRLFSFGKDLSIRFILAPCALTCLRVLGWILIPKIFTKEETLLLELNGTALKLTVWKRHFQMAFAVF